jgi:hypothetical protein
VIDPHHTPILHATPIRKLRPTQMTLGMHEVGKNRKAWGAAKSAKLDVFLERHMVPVVIGPAKELYLIDHHHLARALLDEKVESVFVTIVDDLSMVKGQAFWTYMEFHGWTHPYDGKGRRHDYADLPKSIAEMVDDPYRSLSGELRDAGGYAKDAQPYAEFVWADFLRPLIKAKSIKRDFTAALAVAMRHAKSDEASYLPGWCGAKGGGVAAPPEDTKAVKSRRSRRVDARA